MQCIGGFLLLFVYKMRINLRGFDVSMSHQRFDCVYVNTICLLYTSDAADE